MYMYVQKHWHVGLAIALSTSRNQSRQLTKTETKKTIYARSVLSSAWNQSDGVLEQTMVERIWKKVSFEHWNVSEKSKVK